jgi:hypothetical protein
VPGHDDLDNMTQLDNTTTRHALQCSAHLPVTVDGCAALGAIQPMTTTLPQGHFCAIPSNIVHRVSFTITTLTLPCAIIYTTRIADSWLTPAGAGLALAALQPASWAVHAAQVNRAHTSSHPIAGASSFVQHDRNPSRNTGESNVADHVSVFRLLRPSYT